MQIERNTGLPFMKMHGLGNDFVVLDARARPLEVTPALARALGDRHRGVGFDQLAIMRNHQDALHLTFYNTDGSRSAACGNATRCIARHVMTEHNLDRLSIFTERGQLEAVSVGDGHTAVNMGQPQTAWQDIPLARKMETLALPIDGVPTATGMGNPHCTFFVNNTDDVDLESFGAAHEHHPLFPERTNVQIAQIIARDRIRMRVWERGVGITLASGSSSCAVAVAAARRGLAERKVRLLLDGGEIEIDWRDDGVWMSGPTAHVFSGTLTQEFMQALE